jgi:hypothetical protein
MKLPIVLAAAVLVLAAPARAATWKQVTASGGINIDEVNTARTADGVLHVVWRHQAPPAPQALMHTAILADGRVGATTPVVTGWATIENPAVVVTPAGLRVIWGGIRSIAPGETNTDINTATSSDGGATWALRAGSITSPGSAGFAAPAAATLRPDGTLLEAWAGAPGTFVHAGLDPATPDFNYQPPLGDFGYDPGLATDASGATTLAWYSNATGHTGVFAQGVGADGAPLGAPLNMPDTADLAVHTLFRTPVVARAGGGIYVAYATGYPGQDRIRVWRVGAPAAPLIAHARDDGHAAIAADPKGRIWVAWTDGAHGHVLARRSNRAATRFGAVVDAGAVSRENTVYQLDANATAGALDLLALFFRGQDRFGATYHARVLPGLTLTARRHGRRVAFTVTDAGDPVRGSRVSVGSRTATTDAHGRATLAAPRRATAVARHPGYEPARVKLR